MIQKIDNDGAESCQRLVDRCFQKFVARGGDGARVSPSLSSVRLTPDERARLIASKAITPPEPSSISISTMLIRKKVREQWRRRHRLWGEMTRVARLYLSAPRHHGDLADLAVANNLDAKKLALAVKHEQRVRLRKVAA